MLVRWMRITICAILMIAIMGNMAGAEASGNTRVIVKLRLGALIGPVLALLNAELLDSLPGLNLYLLRVSSIPLLSFTLQLLGVVSIEPDTTINNRTFKNTGLLTTASPPDFYRSQPSLALIRASQAANY